MHSQLIILDRAFRILFPLIFLVDHSISATSARGEEPKGAGPDWWSLQPIVRSEPPKVENRQWVQNPIDAFILARLEAKGLTPSPRADSRTLIRRVTFDMNGLPPTPGEIDDFVKEYGAKPQAAWATLIDRLLASPHYGERWGRHWLDAARFAESHGFEYDRIRDHAWRYRDFVIQSFNADKPYARFVTEQLAGDALSPPSKDGIVATGFLVAGPWDQAGSGSVSPTVRAKVREDELEDLLAAVGQTFLGLTVNCARCHDHKFDPVPTRDYYRMKAIFDGVYHGDRPVSNSSTLAFAASIRQPGPSYLLKRGDPESKGEVVVAGPPSTIRGPFTDLGLMADSMESQRRVKFAQWVTHRDNPLTWRVMANRIWQHHFGEGIVRTPNDLGFNGERPTHPELLDWLAFRFREESGSIKKLHRLILLSSTYQQASIFNEKAANVDGDNRLLWRFAPRRLDAESVRDAMLVISGKLNEKAGGPGFRPFKIETFNSAFYLLIDADTPEFNRRSVYRINVNSAKDPLLDAFDCPDPSVKTPKRAATTTPIQALTLMNSSFVQRQAQAFADRVRKEAGENVDAQIALVYRFALGRSPTAPELQRAAIVVKEHGLRPLCWAVFNSSEFVYGR